ncbi:kinase-like domain-containing protein [Paraphysoderma sedebokerense]|nr:kinase-like domain-containing protein [Paraphysoderma sedebokerense]
MEIYLLKSLNHPNIIKFLDCFEDDNYIIMVTELHGTSWDSTNPVLDPNTHPGLKSEPRRMRVGSEGKGDAHTLASLSSSQKEMLRQRTSCDLFECIGTVPQLHYDKNDYFPERVARHIFKQVASAVAYLHERGIVHRDLKDENIVIDQNYTVKLIDFGSAARIPTLAKDYFDKFLGTLDFAAPEIIDGYRYRGPEAEIWALGVLLYIIVFRQVPFRSPDEIVEAKLEIPARASLGSCGETLLNLLTRMLHPDSYKRLTIEEVLNHPWLQGKPKMPIS